MSEDPVRFAGGENFYAYANGSPYSMVDPLGLFGMQNIFGILKAIGGGVEVVAGGALFGAGVATSEVGVGLLGMAGGAFVVGHGIDAFQAGVRQAWTGNSTDTLTSTGLQAAGMSRRTANLADTGISIVATFGASAGSGVIRTSEGLVHLTSAENAVNIVRTGELAGSNYAGPASNALREGWGVTAATFQNPGTYAAVSIPAAAEGAFSAVRGVGPITSVQAAMGQVYTAAGTLNLATGAFARAGVNMGQATLYGIDAAFTGARIAGSLK
jgi:hypothetical protein